MSTENVIQLLIAAISAGGLGAWLTYKLGSRKQNSSDFEIIVRKYKELYDEHDKKVDKLEKQRAEDIKRITELEREVGDMTNKLVLFESSHQHIPLPIWLKDTNGKMLAVNEEYETKILSIRGLKATDYVGKTDFEVWPKETAEEFIAHDRKVARLKRKIEFTENWKDDDGNLYEGEVIKYPRFVGNTVIGIGGVIKTIKIIK